MRAGQPRRRFGHEGNGSHRFDVSGSVRIGARCGSLGPVERVGVESGSGKYSCDAGAAEHGFWRRGAGSVEQRFGQRDTIYSRRAARPRNSRGR